VLLLLSTADTDLLAARAVPDPVLPIRVGNPARLTENELDLEGVSLVVVRLLGGRRAWEGLDDLLARATVPVVLLGGEAPDAELTALSTVPPGIVADAGDRNPRLIAIAAVIIGIALASIIQLLTGYFTESSRRPVKSWSPRFRTVSV